MKRGRWNRASKMGRVVGHRNRALSPRVVPLELTDGGGALTARFALFVAARRCANTLTQQFRAAWF